MYGGLFGDLPSTKKSKSDNRETNDTAAADSNDSDKAAAGDTAAQASSQQQESTNKNDASKKRPASLVDKLGTAGTRMAFVPAALRNRKRVNSASGPSAAPKQAPKRPAQQPKSGITATTTIVDQAVVSHIHSTDQSQQTSATTTTIAEEEESEAMRQLHSSVVDPYDPHVPNDLLAYWDRRAMEKERLQLERQAKETLQRQERLRQQLEQERTSLTQSGNLEQIVQHRQQTSMGRGRGVSNLPAWLVQKQKNELGSGGGGGVEKTIERQECTVVLSNLTAPGEVDEDLAEEVKEECEEQCGPVTSVIAKDAKPPHQPVVQVHVEFVENRDAKKAVDVFHGRKFGQRRITAELLTRESR